MAEYGREQRNQLIRAVANNKSGRKQLREFVDNRTCMAMQEKGVIPIQRLTMEDNEKLKDAWVNHQDDYYKYLADKDIILDNSEADLTDHDDAAQLKVIQCARTGNTISGPKTIRGYTGVCFLRDANGNIDFSNPQQGYIGNSLGANFTDSSSLVDVSPAVTFYGKWDRYQHFKYANQNTPGTTKGNGGNSPDGYTWHHLTSKYYMHLVDRVVHRSFGHNGGVYLW